MRVMSILSSHSRQEHKCIYSKTKQFHAFGPFFLLVCTDSWTKEAWKDKNSPCNLLKIADSYWIKANTVPVSGLFPDDVERLTKTWNKKA